MDGQTVLGEYTYNAKGQRVKKVAGSTTTIYHYDLMGNLIQETDVSGNVIVSYVYAGMNRIAKVEPSGTIYYYHNDHLGTPLAMTDTSGAVVWKAAYNPFGKAEVDQSSSVTNNFRFPGQYYDSESGLHYNWHRYYDPGIGRYMTPDPVGIGDLSSLYLYVRGNPIKFIDPTGLSPCWDKVQECLKHSTENELECLKSSLKGYLVCVTGCATACMALGPVVYPACVVQCAAACSAAGVIAIDYCHGVWAIEVGKCYYNFYKCNCERK